MHFDLAKEYTRTGPRALTRKEQPVLLCQGSSTTICGQCCVAMLLDCHLEDVIERMGRGGATRTQDLVKLLHRYYPECPDRLVRVAKDHRLDLSGIPQYCIAKLTFDAKANGHWIIRWREFILDPSFGVLPLPRYAPFIDGEVRVTSYLPLHPKG